MIFIRHLFNRLAKSLQQGDVPDDEERLVKEDEAGPNSNAPPAQQQPQRRWAPAKVTLWLLFMDLVIFLALVWTISPLITLLHRNDELFSPTVKFASSAPPPSPNSQESANMIPRILHQTSKNSTIPAKWIETQASCKQIYSGWEYKLWTDESFREFLVEQYPWFVESWDNYPFPIQRADSLRYFVLYHYGGLYLDMDTFCNKSVPIEQFDSPNGNAVFQSTLPTGVTNDFMMSSVRHPAFERLILKLPVYFRRTWWWGHLQPYFNIMVAAGPMFVTLALMGWLFEQPELPSPLLHLVHPDELTPYITDLQSSTWHGADTPVLMWLGVRPWSWYALGFLGLGLGLWLVNHGVVCLLRRPASRKAPEFVSLKEVKLM